jgi:hypothetical protein
MVDDRSARLVMELLKCTLSSALHSKSHKVAMSVADKERISREVASGLQ